jgi:Protein of unknown function (DUF2934)
VAGNRIYFDPLRFVDVPNRDAAARDLTPREKKVADAAYFRAERRGFAPGFEVEDWLAAEAEVDGGGTGELLWEPLP